MKQQEQAVVLSVSLGKGCYRHIQIPTAYTLADLAEVILEAFDFFNDHAHAFFMDNRAWSEADCYYMAEVDENEEYRHTCDYRISQLALEKGDSFKFTFDFGEDWRFQCRVLRVVETAEAYPMLVREVGEAPEQYAEYAEDDDDEYDED